MRRLEEKVAIITGGVQGIGRACALRCGEEGAKVVVADLQEDDSTAREIASQGGESMHIVMDVRKREDWQRIVEQTIERFQRSTFSATSPGSLTCSRPTTSSSSPTRGGTPSSVRTSEACGSVCRPTIPKMIEGGGGRIVNISSLAAIKGLDNLASYSAAKAGVIGLSQQTALEYGQHNVTVNAIAPGTIDTPILQDITDEMREANANSHILKRLGQPTEIAAMMAFFFFFRRRLLHRLDPTRSTAVGRRTVATGEPAAPVEVRLNRARPGRARRGSSCTWRAILGAARR